MGPIRRGTKISKQKPRDTFFTSSETQVHCSGLALVSDDFPNEIRLCSTLKPDRTAEFIPWHASRLVRVSVFGAPVAGKVEARSDQRYTQLPASIRATLNRRTHLHKLLPKKQTVLVDDEPKFSCVSRNIALLPDIRYMHFDAQPPEQALGWAILRHRSNSLPIGYPKAVSRSKASQPCEYHTPFGQSGKETAECIPKS